MLLVLLAILLTVTSPFYFRPVFSTVIYPFQFVAVSAWKGITGIPSFFIHLGNLSEENQKLRNNLNGLTPKLMLFKELSKENDRLRNTLNYKENNPYNLSLLPAQVVSKGPTPWYRILTINLGGRSGIEIDMSVITMQGLVGRVIEVTPFFSKIILLNDDESAVAAIASRSRDFGVIEGGHPNKLFMRYVSTGADIKVGDVILTSRASSIFPPGIPIGTVTHASKREHDLFYQIEVKPAVDFSKIEEVFVVL